MSCFLSGLHKGECNVLNWNMIFSMISCVDSYYNYWIVKWASLLVRGNIERELEGRMRGLNMKIWNKYEKHIHTVVISTDNFSSQYFKNYSTPTGEHDSFISVAHVVFFYLHSFISTIYRTYKELLIVIRTKLINVFGFFMLHSTLLYNWMDYFENCHSPAQCISECYYKTKNQYCFYAIFIDPKSITLFTNSCWHYW